MSSFIALTSNKYDFRSLVESDWLKVTLEDHLNEEGQKSHARERKLKNEVNKLLKLTQNLKDITDARKVYTVPVANVQGPGKVNALKGFWEKQEQRPADEAKLNMQIVQKRKDLSRQGFWMGGDLDGKELSEELKEKLNSHSLNTVVKYDRELEAQEMTKLQILGGLLIYKGEKFDTSKMTTFEYGAGAAIYVMSSEGNLHANSHSVGHYHHSSLLAAQKVAGAGEMVVRNGRINYLSNKSGHYMPSDFHLLCVLAMLQKKGIPLDFKIRSLKYGEYNTVKEYMYALELDDDILLGIPRPASDLGVNGLVDPGY